MDMPHNVAYQKGLMSSSVPVAYPITISVRDSGAKAQIFNNRFSMRGTVPQEVMVKGHLTNAIQGQV